MFGRDILVAPLMEDVPSRNVYLPPGQWVDYQGGKTYEGAAWHHITAGEIPIVLLVKEGAAIPHAHLAQSTSEMNWQEIELVVFGAETPTTEGYVYFPEGDTVHHLRLERGQDGRVLTDDPLEGKVAWRVNMFG